MRPKLKKIKEVLNKLYQSENRISYISQDPIQFPHRYSSPEDIELVGFIASAFAFGRVSLILPNIQKILDRMGKNPYSFIMNFNVKKDQKHFQDLYYRIWTAEDIVCFTVIIQSVLKKYGTLGAFFTQCYQQQGGRMDRALSHFVDKLLDIDPTPIYGKNTFPRSMIHLLPSPKRGSACKRLNLFLRWMVRSGDGVDFGLWKNIPASGLIIPLDVHIIRISRYLGFHHRNTPNWKMAVEITNQLKRLDPSDPIKYDFTLCHLGISEQCPPQPVLSKCIVCELQSTCSCFQKLKRKKHFLFLPSQKHAQ